MEKGTIIVLNGVSSSGKSSLAKEIVSSLPSFFVFSIDDFDTVIEKMENREQQKLIPVETEYFYHQNAAMFSDQGISLVLDQMLHDEFTLQSFYQTLKAYPVVMIGVHCGKQELQRRELERANRRIGQAIEQLRFVHRQEVYDVEVDTSTNTLEECARQIVNRVQNKEPYFGFHQSLKYFEFSQKNVKIIEK